MSIQIGNVSKQGKHLFKKIVNVKTTFKNIFHNLIHIDFTIFCLQMSIQIGNVSKQGKNLYKQTNNNYGWI